VDRVQQQADEELQVEEEQFLLFFDLQFLVGLLLYAVFSPLTRAAFTDFGAAMRDSVLRFFAVEHIFGMVVALALAHIGRGRLRRLTDDTARHRTMAIFFTLALVIMLVTIPWPFMPAGRPYFRGF
jgi:NhaP-type Na+/H+ or K+/H+ antiporter